MTNEQDESVFRVQDLTLEDLGLELELWLVKRLQFNQFNRGQRDPEKFSSPVSCIKCMQTHDTSQ